VEGRAHDRYAVWLPVQVSGDEIEGAIGVSKNASEGGVLISATGPLDIGARVTLTFTLIGTDGKDPTEHAIPGTIVRVDPNVDDPDGAFPFRIAAKFDQPLVGLGNVLAAMEVELLRSK
jgi:hypothetical protein